jgi:TPR repeat protein
VPIHTSTAFVSYSREDLDFVVRLAKDVKEKGARLWVDKVDIHPGQRWEAEIEAAVSACSRMLVVLSPAAISSRNVLAEASLAIDDGKEVIPVLYRDCKVPFRLRPLQYADFRTDYATGLTELLAVLTGGTELTPPVTSEQTRLEGERQQAAAEQAQIEREENERKITEEKARKEELERQSLNDEQARVKQERQRVAAEQAHLDEERKQAAVEKIRLEELERKAAEEKSKQAEADRRAIAAEQARVEQELARTEREARERREAEEKARLAGVPTPASNTQHPSAPAEIRLVSDTTENSWIKPVGIGLAVLFVIGLIVVIVWQRSNEANEEAYARSVAEEQARAERAQKRGESQQSSTTTQSSQPSSPPEESKPQPKKPQQTQSAKVNPPIDLTKNSTSPTSSRALGNTAPAKEAGLPPGLSSKTTEFYRKAQAGNPDAMVDLAFAFDQGNGAPKDYGQAVYWYRKAAEAGDALGMTNLGIMYQNGRGVQQDDGQAVSWYRKAAEAGNSKGMLSLGVMYYEGRGVQKNDSQALNWFQNAAELGERQAILNLAVMYGEGLEQDCGKAIKLLQKLADSGDSAAQNDLAYILATCENQYYRNPSEALKYAQKAVLAAGPNPDPNYFDTLAEAYYAIHKYQDAVTTELRAISGASEQQKKEFQKHLQKYQLAVAASNLRQ